MTHDSIFGANRIAGVVRGVALALAVLFAFPGESIASPGRSPDSNGEPPCVSRQERHERSLGLGISELVEDLVDDDVKWNASASARELKRRMADPSRYEGVWRELDQALFSSDEQQRRIATGLLHSLSRIQHRGVEPHVPSERLLDLTTDHLAVWTSAQYPSWIAGDVDDEKSVAFTIDHMEKMENRLAGKLSSVPASSRFIYAYILAREGRTQHASLVVPELVKCLRDNHTRNDALMSMEALFRLGDVAIPWLRDALAEADDQQRTCIQLLLLEYSDPATTPEMRAMRRHLNCVTWKCDDPVQSWHYPFPDPFQAQEDPETDIPLRRYSRVPAQHQAPP